MLEKKSILAIVVTYHPDSSFAERFERLAGQVDSVLIVDNNSDAAAVSMLREMASRPNVKLILNSNNLGIATALNIGVKSAIAQDYEWVATFDQDSSIVGNYFEDLLQAYENCRQRNNIAMLSPVYCEQALGNESLLAKQIGVGFVEVEKTMTSGSLVKTDCFRSVGLFDESFFIDFVDHEFTLRLMKAGYRIIRANSCMLLHRLGRTTPHRILGWHFYSSGHDSMRRYYIARNRIVVYKRYGTFRPFWIVKDLASFLREIAKIALVEENAAAKLSATVKGICHGILGRTGSL
jgi:rhamnosyltransferase